MDASTTYAFLTDAVPWQTGGAGCEVLARDWLASMGEQVRIIITHRSLGRGGRAEDERDQPVERVYYYNLGGWGLGRLPLLRRCLEWLIFLFVLPHLVRAVRRSGAQRIFALSGAAPGFLFFASMLARASGLPLDFFLVDDYEEFVRHGSQGYLVPAVRFFERRYLARADRVFTISPGYADHLWTKYGQRAHWLPVLVAGGVPRWQPYDPATPDERHLIFVGSVNFLYEENLVDLYRAIVEWNRHPGAFRLRLKIVTRTRPESLLEQLPSTDHLDLVLDADDNVKTQHVRTAWAIVLPYAFAAKARFFVATSFSYKFTDAITAGRPILVYGPPYASIPRYFREESLPLGANSMPELVAALDRIEACDHVQTIAQYADVIARHHSQEALRRVLAESPSTAAPARRRPHP